MDMAAAVDRLEVGTKVEVRRRYDQSWTRGFAVAAVVDGGYRVRRLSDGSLVPAVFTPDDVRPARKQSMWWY